MFDYYVYSAKKHIKKAWKPTCRSSGFHAHQSNKLFHAVTKYGVCELPLDWSVCKDIVEIELQGIATNAILCMFIVFLHYMLFYYATAKI